MSDRNYGSRKAKRTTKRAAPKREPQDRDGRTGLTGDTRRDADTRGKASDGGWIDPPR